MELLKLLFTSLDTNYPLQFVEEKPNEQDPTSLPSNFELKEAALEGETFTASSDPPFPVERLIHKHTSRFTSFLDNDKATLAQLKLFIKTLQEEPAQGRTLRHLIIGQNKGRSIQLTLELLELIEAVQEGLEELSLHRIKLDDFGGVMRCAANLKYLELHSCRIGSPALVHILSPIASALTTLNIDHCRFNADGLPSLTFPHLVDCTYRDWTLYYDRVAQMIPISKFLYSLKNDALHLSISIKKLEAFIEDPLFALNWRPVFEVATMLHFEETAFGLIMDALIPEDLNPSNEDARGLTENLATRSNAKILNLHVDHVGWIEEVVTFFSPRNDNTVVFPKLSKISLYYSNEITEKKGYSRPGDGATLGLAELKTVCKRRGIDVRSNMSVIASP